MVIVSNNGIPIALLKPIIMTAMFFRDSLPPWKPFTSVFFLRPPRPIGFFDLFEKGFIDDPIP